MELLLHRFFGKVCLDVEIRDENGNHSREIKNGDGVYETTEYTIDEELNLENQIRPKKHQMFEIV